MENKFKAFVKKKKREREREIESECLFLYKNLNTFKQRKISGLINLHRAHGVSRYLIII